MDTDTGYSYLCTDTERQDLETHLVTCDTESRNGSGV